MTREEHIKRLKDLDVDVNRLEDGIEVWLYIPNSLVEKLADLIEKENDSE